MKKALLLNKAKLSSVWMVITIIFAISGCSRITPNFAPSQPLEVDEFQVSLNLSCSLNDLSRFGFATQFQYGISSKEIIGTSITGLRLIFPSSLSYTNFSKFEDGFVYWGARINDIFGFTYNPLWESSIGYSKNDFSLNSGIGYYSNYSVLNSIRYSSDKQKHRNCFTFIVSTSYNPDNIGLGLFYIGKYQEITIAKSKARLLQPYKNKLTFDTTEIDSLIINPKTSFTRVEVKLKSGEIVRIADREPFADCLHCPFLIKQLSIYPESEKHNTYWITFRNMASHEIVNIDLNERLEQYFAKGLLDLRTNADIIDRIVSRNRKFSDNCYFGMSVK
jgi:hypothetical protein